MTVGTDLPNRADPSPITRVGTLTELGLIRGRRSEPGAWDYLDRAMTDADQSGEPQRIVPARLARAEAYWLEGKLGEAAREAELADDGSARCDAWDRGAVAVGDGASHLLAHRSMTSPSPAGGSSTVTGRSR